MSTIAETRFVILCEDRRHFYFTRGFLEKKGAKPGSVTDNIMGSSKLLLDKYPAVLKEFRKAAASQKNIALVVVCDADNRSVLQRQNDIQDNERMEKLSQKPRTDGEKILFIIPKRNIETWFHFLDGNAINEDKDYKVNHRDARPGVYGKTMAQRCNAPVSLGEISSLENACDEWRTRL